MLTLAYYPPHLRVDLESGPAGRRTIEMIRAEILRARENVRMTFCFCALIFVTLMMLANPAPGSWLRPLTAIPFISLIITATVFNAALQRALAGLEHTTPAHEEIATTLAQTSPIVARYLHSIHMQGRGLISAEFRAIEHYIESHPVTAETSSRAAA